MLQQQLGCLPSRVGLKPFTCRDAHRCLSVSRCFRMSASYSMMRCSQIRRVVVLGNQEGFFRCGAGEWRPLGGHSEESGQWRCQSCCTSTVPRRSRAWSLKSMLWNSDDQHKSCGPYRLPETERCSSGGGTAVFLFSSGQRCYLSARNLTGVWGL